MIEIVKWDNAQNYNGVKQINVSNMMVSSKLLCLTWWCQAKYCV